MSWNVNGMKALVNSNLPVLRALLEKHKPALLCLQEIKLQTDAVDEYKLATFYRIADIPSKYFLFYC